MSQRASIFCCSNRVKFLSIQKNEEAHHFAAMIFLIVWKEEK